MERQGGSEMETGGFIGPGCIYGFVTGNWCPYARAGVTKIRFYEFMVPSPPP